MTDRSRKAIYYILALLIAIAGISLRVLYYSYARPFWNDESALAINLVNRSFSELWLPLDYEQFTPPLYACFCKLCALFIQNKEYAFRLPALLFGIVSVPLFYFFSCKVIKNYAGRIFALLLFAFNYQLIYYSQELKQYSCDVFMFLAVLLSYFFIDKEKNDVKKLIAFNLLFSLSFWFSYTAVFAVFILGLLCIRYGKKTLLSLFSLPFISGLLLIFYTKRFHTNAMLNDFWSGGFIEHNFSNIKNLINTNLIFYFSDFPSKLFIILLFIAGIILVFKKFKNKEYPVVGVSFVFALVLSYCGIYPLYLRTAIYILPLFFIILALPFEYSGVKNKLVSYFVAAFLFAHFFVCTFKTDYLQIIKKQYYTENTKELLALFAERSKPQDILIVPNLTGINFEYYKSFVNLSGRQIFVLKKQLFEYKDIKNAYDTLDKGRTYYILFTHSADKPYVYKNLCAYAEEHKNTEIFSDKNYNALIKFAK